ncbi:MAG: amidohydrolase family protein [Lachnospiraceae bacterium]|nr:amidohydrolase family protein [Lachnospiraceae bacterium]
MAIIDFRVRPPYGTYQNFVNNINEEALAKYGFEYKGSLKSKSFDDFIKELDATGVEKVVLQGRHGMGLYVENNELFELADKYPERFIVFPFFDPLEGQKALDEIDTLIINGKGKGASLEPGFPEEGKPGYKFDDAGVYPFYKKLEENNIPILLTYSSFALEVLDTDSPRQLDQVAKDFPNLKIVVAHGGWPWTLESIAIAFKRPNIFLSPDIYATRGPGAHNYITAAKTILKDKIIFGSSYPIIPIDQTIELIKNEWGLDEETLKKVLYENAAKILNLY